MMRLAFALLSATGLSGCLAAPPADDPSLLRTPTVPLSITTRGGSKAMVGTWQVRASSPGYRDIQTLSFNIQGKGQHSVEVMQIGCGASGGCETVADGWLAEPLAQNRWRLTSETAQENLELWVIWIDEGFRTAAIGSPDSDMAFILDRKSKGGQDRIIAAGEVLAFNGYNMAAFIAR